MANRRGNNIILLQIFVVWSLIATAAFSLSPYYYQNICPKALPTIKKLVEAAVYNEPRMGASLLRLHFHDCFVNGCDASVLLDPTPTIDSEKNAPPNLNSLRGFEVIDQIKAEVDKVCGCSVVSCADILAIVARDSVVALGGPSWKVQLGRRDSTTAIGSDVLANIPAPTLDLPSLITNFKSKGLDERDLVALSGSHTVGFAQCFTFRDRIYNATNIDPAFAQERKQTCPRSNDIGNTNLAPLNPTPEVFDTAYFDNLVKQRGLLVSDQSLFSGGPTDELVRTYSLYPEAFFNDFGQSMIKMGNIMPLTGKQGQVRVNCRRVNDY